MLKLIISLLISGGFLMASPSKQLDDSWYSNMDKISLAEIRARVLMTHSINPLPYQLDSSTYLTSVKMEPNNYTIELEYLLNEDELIAELNKRVLPHQTISKLSPSFKKKLLPAIRHQLFKSLCQNPKTAYYIKRGISYKHTYFFNNQVFIMEHTVNKKTCE